MLQYVHGTYILLHVKVVERSTFCRRDKDITGYFVDILKLRIVLLFDLSEDT
jgi:hypothetical protein